MLQFCRVDRITKIVAGPVGDKGYQLFRVTLGASEFPVHDRAEKTNEIDVFPLVTSTDSIGFTSFAVMVDHIDRADVIDDPEPVSHILTFSVNRQRFPVFDVVDTERNQLFGKLESTVVVRAVADKNRKTVRIVPGSCKMV